MLTFLAFLARSLARHFFCRSQFSLRSLASSWVASNVPEGTAGALEGLTVGEPFGAGVLGRGFAVTVADFPRAARDGGLHVTSGFIP